MLLIITGDGKGKTTSAVGTAIRSIGWDYKTAIVFFDKGGEHYGEQNTLDLLKDKLDVYRFGLKRFDEEKNKFRFENIPGDLEEAEKAAEKVIELLEGEYFSIIADEIINAMNLGLLPEDRVKEIIEKKPEDTNLILTGRNVPDWLHEKADLISEVKMVKHYFQKGVNAQKGIEF